MFVKCGSSVNRLLHYIASNLNLANEANTIIYGYLVLNTIIANVNQIIFLHIYPLPLQYHYMSENVSI